MLFLLPTRNTIYSSPSLPRLDPTPRLIPDKYRQDDYLQGMRDNCSAGSRMTNRHPLCPPTIAVDTEGGLTPQSTQDFITGDEVLSDSYPMKEVDGIVYETDCAMINLEAVNVGTSCRPRSSFRTATQPPRPDSAPVRC
jgi:hypothetical protein